MNIKVKNLSGGISIITINEPKTYNSLSFKNLKDLIKVFQILDKDLFGKYTLYLHILVEL